MDQAKMRANKQWKGFWRGSVNQVRLAKSETKWSEAATDTRHQMVVALLAATVNQGPPSAGLYSGAAVSGRVRSLSAVVQLVSDDITIIEISDTDGFCGLLSKCQVLHSGPNMLLR